MGRRNMIDYIQAHEFKISDILLKLMPELADSKNLESTKNLESGNEKNLTTPGDESETVKKLTLEIEQLRGQLAERDAEITRLIESPATILAMMEDDNSGFYESFSVKQLRQLTYMVKTRKTPGDNIAELDKSSLIELFNSTDISDVNRSIKSARGYDYLGICQSLGKINHIFYTNNPDVETPGSCVRCKATSGRDITFIKNTFS